MRRRNRETGGWRRWAAAIGFAALGAPGAAAAQEALCQNPNGFCTPMIQVACVGDLLGAGAARLEVSASDCASQRSAYIQCIQSAAQLCPKERPAPQAVSASAGGCTPEDARAIWDELRESFFVEDLEGFAEMCSGRPQAMLAANRANRIKSGEVKQASASAGDDGPVKGWQIVEAQAHLARLGYYENQPSGVWDRPSSAALGEFQQQAGLQTTGKLTVGGLAALRERPTPEKRERQADLRGVWRGAYAYDDDREPVGFTLKLDQRSKDLIGRSDEPQTFGTPGAGTLFANWTGKISDDGLLAFVKTYDGTGGQNHSITYTGRLVSPNRIEGRWSINSYTNGTFNLTR